MILTRSLCLRLTSQRQQPADPVHAEQDPHLRTSLVPVLSGFNWNLAVRRVLKGFQGGKPEEGGGKSHSADHVSHVRRWGRKTFIQVFHKFEFQTWDSESLLGSTMTFILRVMLNYFDYFMTGCRVTSGSAGASQFISGPNKSWTGSSEQIQNLVLPGPEDLPSAEPRH